MRLIHTISTTEACQHQLETVFNNAKKFGQGSGYKLESIWNEDT